ncbi:hypothetical protein [Candidatus Poriferisodalis sp.]|uniref:hypothetical protein n=1 Tax=Candidatus Poriferisodalis sp. TaxID=3101277 RepID=UPI003B01D579
MLLATAVNPAGAQDSTESPPEDSADDSSGGGGPADGDSETQTESMPPLVIGGGNSAAVPSGFSGVLGRFHIEADDDSADGGPADGGSADGDTADADSTDADSADADSADADSADADSADADSADADSADACVDDDNAADEVQWSLSGPDSDLLQISNSGVLCFAAPRFAQFVGGNDANGDDVFEVTVEASTSAGRSGSADTSVGVFGDGPRVIDIHLGPANPDERLILQGERSVYYPGDTITAAVAFGYGDIPISVRVGGSPQLMLNVGGTPRVAEYISSHNSDVYFQYTVADDDEDASGVSIDRNSLRLNGGSIADASGARSPLTHLRVRNSPDHVVQPVPFEIAGPAALTVYGGDKFVHKFAPSEPALLRWFLLGPDSRYFQVAGDGVANSGKTVELNFASRPDHATPRDADGQNDYEVTLIAIAEEDIAAAGEDFSGIGKFGGFEATIDLVVTVVAPPPEIVNVAFGPSPAGGNYAIGDVISVNVWFDTAITVTGTPQIALDIGGVERLADYDSEPAAATSSPLSDVEQLLADSFSGAAAVFRYTVVEGDADSDGVTIAANSLRLNGGTIVRAEGTAANLKHTAVQGGSGQRVATPGGL